MERFLVQAAKHLLDHHKDDLPGVCVILPTRRAGLYMKKALGRTAGKPIIAPAIFSIEDLIREISPVRIIDNTEALMLLYGIHKPKDGEKKEPFEEFSRWAAVFLSDIQEIDRYLVDPSQLFGNLEGIKELESWSLNDPQTTFQDNYLQFWRSLHALYIDFNALLDEKGIAYEGKALRMIVSDIQKYLKPLPYSGYYAVGFNALSKAEEKFFQSLHKTGKLQVLWDGDVYYYSDPNHEAGKFLRKSVPAFASGKSAPAWIGDHLSSTAKEIQITGSPSNMLQVKAAAEWIAKVIEKEEEHTHTAWVLADESLLLPVLNAIPSAIKSVNVSMGYSLKFASFAGFIDALLNLHENADRLGRKMKNGELLYYHKDVEALLLQPMFRELSGDPVSIRQIPEEMRSQNRSFVSAGFLCAKLEPEQAGFIRMITSDLTENNILSILERLAGESIRILDEKAAGNYSMEKEFIVRFLELFRTMDDYHKQYALFGSFKTIRAFLKQSLGTLFMPFFGEPLEGIQVMGMLETRCLDFDNIAILSVNENVLPAGKNTSTYIPYDLRRHFGLPTYQDRDAIFSYHFYRMLQRAGNAHCFYTTVKDVFGSGEKSRFLSQLIHELPLRNKNVKITENLLAPSGSIAPPAPVFVGKEADIMDKLHAYLKQGISPSSLNTFRACPLRFCFKSVIGIAEQEEVEESMDSRMLGNAIHGTLEKLYKPFESGPPLSVSDVNDMRRISGKILKDEFEVILPGEEAGHGRNFLALKAGEKYLEELLLDEAKYLTELNVAGKSMSILHLEKEFTAPLKVNGIEIRIKGFCDRVDKVGDTIRIIDYKTGQVEDKELKGENVEAILTGEGDKAVQLLMYALLYRRENGNAGGQLSSGIISFRRLSQGFMPLRIGGNEVIGSDDVEHFQKGLEELIAGILDPTIPFRQTEDRELCVRCEFRSVCSR